MMESKRGGSSTNHWSGNGSQPQLQWGQKDIQFYFSMRSKGGGVTDCMVRATSDEFGRITTAMAKADPEQGYYKIARALLDVDFDEAVAAFERAKQEWIDQEKQWLERRRELATERGRLAAQRPDPV